MGNAGHALPGVRSCVPRRVPEEGWKKGRMEERKEGRKEGRRGLLHFAPSESRLVFSAFQGMGLRLLPSAVTSCGRTQR
jgi:hypothetical protein